MLLALYPLLLLPPLRLGDVRVGQVSVAWWYAGVLAPLLAVLLALSCLKSSRPGTPSPVAGRIAAWLVPSLLLSIPVRLLSDAREGLWIGLLVVVAPLLAFLVASRPPARPAPALVVPGILRILVVGLIFWTNLLLAGDLARWLGLPRLSGILLAGGGAILVVAVTPGRRRRPAFLPLALLALVVPLVLIAGRLGWFPHEAWIDVASRQAFRFSPRSPWVVEGRPVQARRGTQTLRFDEEHRITALSEGPLRIVVSDRPRPQVHEWGLKPGQSVIVRPGDRLLLDPERRLRFEANKRVPGAPESGVRWADPPMDPPGPGLLSLLGVGLTILGGAAALLNHGRSVRVSRLRAILAGTGCLTALFWAEGWAIYTISTTPEVFLGGLTHEELFELPRLIFPHSPWGPALEGFLVFGGFLALLASAVALKELLPGSEDERGLWIMMVGVLTLGSLWPLAPWRLLLVALGLGASTLAPLAWVGVPAGRPWAATLGMAPGVSVFLALTVLGRLGAATGPWGQALMNYPTVAALPVSIVIFRILRRPSLG
ncbi:MAG: hypothetical protein ACE5JD_16895 [Candidatus Methylomirabilia bacterium]